MTGVLFCFVCFLTFDIRVTSRGFYSLTSTNAVFPSTRWNNLESMTDGGTTQCKYFVLDSDGSLTTVRSKRKLG